MELWSGWSRGDAWGGPGPLLFFGPTEARRAKKKIWRPLPPSPHPPALYLSVWMTGSIPLSKGLDPPLIWLVENLFHPMRSSNIRFFSQATACTRTLRNNSTLACFTEIRMWHTRNPSAVIRLGPSRINTWRSLDAHSILQGNKHHTKWVEMHSRDSYKDIM